MRALGRGAPDMNSLVGLGAVSSFAVSCVAAALPGLGWRTFFEEPAMLLGVVLLGRSLEYRQKLMASSDMEQLQVRSSCRNSFLKQESLLKQKIFLKRSCVNFEILFMGYMEHIRIARSYVGYMEGCLSFEKMY